ncbi:MAG TPA: hypothetical protein VEL74_25375 [Thermoanaerobaculia bacterium]|nr:hypothetical protein [Thermoanaerobaculia bacterium]
MPNVTRSHAAVRKALEQYNATLEANAAELPQLDGTRTSIQNVLQTLRESSVEQDFFRAQKQQATKRQEAAVDEGRKLISYVKVVLRQHYGSRSEKLAEFGVQPFRGRARTAVAEVKPRNPGATVAPEVQEPKAEEREG